MASSSSAAKSLFQKLGQLIKKPWEITGPCASPEYRSAVPGALEYRRHAPASVPGEAIIPTSDPETVFDIKYHTRDQRRNRLPATRTVVRKADAERMMREKERFEVAEFPRVYLTDAIVEDENARGGGYQ